MVKNKVHSIAVSYILLSALLLSSCAPPSKQFDEFAEQLNFKQEVVAGEHFIHAIYEQENEKKSSELHVYLDGDGTPWFRETQISFDPTPRNPLVLKLMHLDSTPSLYLGRPCYHGLSDSPNCSPEFWTSHRYSKTVIDSLEVALKNKMSQSINHYDDLVFIGFSGGGTLAVLLAERFPESKMVITIGANLDHDIWSRHHNYSPLWGSLNPSKMPPLSKRIKQVHLVGEKDSIVPPWIVSNSVNDNGNMEIITTKGFTHHCCWEEIWSERLQSLNKF